MPFRKLNLKFLIVEDNPGDFVLIEDYLKEEIDNPDIVNAPSFKMAREALCGDNYFDVILLDLSLPDVSGEQLIQEVLACADNSPVIVLTGNTDKSFSVKTLSLGVSDYLMKDELTPPQLYKSIFYSIERKRFELKLKESSDLLLKITNKVPVALYQFEISDDGKMSFPFMSKGIEDILPGITVEMVQQDASNCFSAVLSEDFERVMQTIDESRDRLTDWEQEFRIMREGKINWVKGSSKPEKRENGAVVWCGYLEDITDARLATENMRLSKERYDIVATATSDTIWDWDILKGTMQYSFGVSQMFGYNHDEIKNVDTWWMEKIHPDDLPGVRDKIDELFEKRNPNLQLEYRFRCSNGSYKYILDRGFMILNKEGIPTRMIGAMQDITERTKHIKAIEVQNAKLREIAWTQSHIVRAPLARIMGIVDLFNSNALNDDEMIEYLNYILTSANELDNVIKSIILKTVLTDETSN